jgi:putative transposase
MIHEKILNRIAVIFVTITWRIAMWIQSLEDFIRHSQDKREITRAMAVKMLLLGYKHQEIMPILGVSSGFISTWKKAFFQTGVDGLKLAYKGSQGFLNTSQHQEVIEWLQTKNEWTLNELEYQVASEYGVTFESQQSYYDLFHEARISWKKTQADNPKYAPELVALKKKRFVNCWRSDELKSRQES